MPERAARAVVSDDGTIWLTAYGEGGVVVPVALLPVRAVALAGELIEAALPKLGNVVEENSTKSKGGRRGGDPLPEQRRELHDGLRGMAFLLGLGRGKSAAEVAREIAERCNRYQPMSAEIDAVRRAMLRVRNAGVPMPTSERHLIRIISGRTSNDEQKTPIGCPTIAPITE
jgi:hypothetical protein